MAEQVPPRPTTEGAPVAHPPATLDGGFAPVQVPSRRHDQTIVGDVPTPPGRGGAATPTAPADDMRSRTLMGVAPGAFNAAPTPPARRPAASGVGNATLVGVAPAAGGKTPAPNQTLLGVAPAGSAGETPAPNQTLFGVAPAGSAGETPAPNQTLVGVVPAELSAALAAARGAAGASADGPSDESLEPAASPDGALAAATSDVDARSDTAPVPTPAPDAPAAPRAALHAKTALGVALPGIAPLRPGASSPAGVDPQSAAAGSWSAADSSSPLDAAHVDEPSNVDASLAVPTRARLPRSALVLIASGIVLAGAALAFALLWKGSKTVSAVVGTDREGRERIDVVCVDCPDGTQITLGGTSAEVSDRKAYLRHDDPLPLGQNTLSLEIERPGGKAESVSVTLPPLEYRIRARTDTLSEAEPRLTLDVEAMAGSRAHIGGKEVALDEQGRGQGSSDVSARLEGNSSEVESFEQDIEYAIEVASGRKYAGKLSVRVSVTPLLLEAPGTDTVTDLERFMLAGRTAKGASVQVAGNAIPVDAEGRFAQLMSIDSVGVTEVKVRADHEGLAPRFATFRLERVASLRERALELARDATQLEDLANEAASHVGARVQVSGVVEEVKVDGRRTLILLRRDGKCPTALCLARLTYGGLRTVTRKQKLSAIGRLLGSVRSSGAGRDVPDVEVMLLR